MQMASCLLVSVNNMYNYLSSMSVCVRVLQPPAKLFTTLTLLYYNSNKTIQKAVI